jgi:hypothetical protein
MKFILILLLYAQTGGSPVSITTAEFDDLAACNAAEAAAIKLVVTGGRPITAGMSLSKSSTQSECVPKATAPPDKK